jgi:8-amino-7-oxononanoate synthase
VPDFASALYLGLEHSYASLPAWRRLSLGKPAVLGEVEGTDAAQQELAALTGCDRALFAPSTLHVFIDLFLAFGEKNVTFLLDEDVYPVVRRAALCATSAGSVVETFGSRCRKRVTTLIQRCGVKRPVIVTDGFYPLRGKHSPLRVYARLAGAAGGFVVVDDTQALGIFGSKPRSVAPYGMGGGGSLRLLELEGSDVVVVASLAKAFGVPVAVIAGPFQRIHQFERRSFTRIHSSPVSAAMMASVRSAAQINRLHGEWLRRRLARLVRKFQNGLRELGLSHTHGCFPVQTVEDSGGLDAVATSAALEAAGVQTVVTRDQPFGTPKMSFILTAAHQEEEIDQALACLARIRRL